MSVLKYYDSGSSQWLPAAYGMQGIQGVTGAPYYNVPINTQTGTSYTLIANDNGFMVLTTNSSPVTITVPPNSSVAFPIGATIDIYQYGAGQVTIAAGAGVTLRSYPGLKIVTQYCGAQIRKIATDEWIVIGSLSA